MTSIAVAWTDGWRRTLRDPALFATVIVLWAFLALFILFPLAKLLARTFLDGGQITLGNLVAILRDANHRQAFWNSLLLAALVGLCGTVLGFLYAFAAVSTHDGVIDSLVLPWANAETMQVFLAEMARRHAVEFIMMVMDQAGWHIAGHLDVPQNMRLEFLPALS